MRVIKWFNRNVDIDVFDILYVDIFSFDKINSIRRTSCKQDLEQDARQWEDLGKLGTRKSYCFARRSVTRSCNKVHGILVTDSSDLEPNILSFIILAASIQNFLYPDHGLSLAESLFDEKRSLFVH